MSTHEHELSPIPRAARAFQGQTAGVVTRVVAAALDTAVVAVALVAAYLSLAGLQFLVDPRSFSFPDFRPFASLLVATVVLGLYLSVAWALGGRTYGNLLMGLRVVGSQGGGVGWARALLRAAGYVLFPIGLLWVAIDHRQRSVQDRLLLTSVVYDWTPRAARWSSR